MIDPKAFRSTFLVCYFLTFSQRLENGLCEGDSPRQSVGWLDINRRKKLIKVYKDSSMKGFTRMARESYERIFL
jgi:hypothetical protein